MNDAYGKELKGRRQRANLTQAELARKLRDDYNLTVAPRTIQKWEAGVFPRPRHRRALAAFFATEQAA